MERINDKLLNWASILEDNTRQQAILSSSMPFIFPHIALMPDAHLGLGATVGSVIPTRGAIMPAAVGVDIGCVDADSEYLAPDGWHRIADYVDGPVMQYDPADGSGQFVEPSRFVVRDAGSFYHLKSKYGVNQMLTPDHKVLCWRIVGRNRRRVQTVMTAAEFVAHDRRLVLGYKAEFATTFVPQIDTKLDLDDIEIRVQVMLSADGSINHRQAYLHLRKTRKIERARSLLAEAGIPFRERQDQLGDTIIVFRPPVLTKDLTQMWTASLDQLRIIADECLQWDGNIKDRVFFTRVRAYADFIHYVFTATGYRAVMRADAHWRDGKTDYRVFAQTNTMVGITGHFRTPTVEVPSVDGKAYCFTVPSGFWVMRRGGNIVMTGNCGMQAVRTQFTVHDIISRGNRLPGTTLRDLHAGISARIPLSVGGSNQHDTDSAIERIIELEELPGVEQADQIGVRWRRQLGSLGSGNHFIEISLDEQDRVWTFLHSGSRGVGNKLAQKHIRIARELCDPSKLPHPDLAYLIKGTTEFAAYIEALMWAQRFAALNRDEMMDRVLDALDHWMGVAVEAQEVIACHHNYTEPALWDDEPIWLSRKGAINALEGRPGLIPGSMGAASYIVEGLGNQDALWSAPHGAGRNYSRSAARKTFTRADLDTRMAGITWGESDAFLDEHPDAYKDIGVVMADAADLVSVRHTLRQLVNVKGD